MMEETVLSDEKVCECCGNLRSSDKFKLFGRPEFCVSCYNKEKYRLYRQKPEVVERHRASGSATMKRQRAGWTEKRREKERARDRERGRSKDNRRRARVKTAVGSFTVSEFKRLCAQYGNACLCCGSVEKLTVDHVVPLSRGGSNYISNIQPLCHRCNSEKGTKSTDHRIGKPKIF